MRNYAGMPAQQRRDERRARFLAAGLQVVGTRGWQRATVRAVCAEAGLTARYFYEAFADRDALLLAVFDEAAAEVAAGVLRALDDAPGDALGRSRAAIGAAVDLLISDPRKASVLFTPAAGVAPLESRRAAALRAFADLVAEQARSFYGLPAADRRLRAAAIFVTGGLVELARAWLDGEVEATRDELVEQCAELFAVRGSGPAPRSAR